MEDNQIIDKLISVLDAEDMWFTQKTDPTFGEAPDYFKLNEYGDLTDASVKKIVKEITSLIGDGAVDIEDAINLWLQDAMADNKVGYRDMLVTKFKDKPVVDGIEAYKNPVQLSESKSLKTENKVFNALNELNASNFVELKDEIEELYNKEIIDDDQYDNFIDIIDEQENACEDYLNRRSKVTNTDWKDELGIESDYVVSALQMLIAEVTDLDESKKTESIYDLDKNAEIKKGKCPYCGSTNLEYEDDAREPRVAEYDDYVSYGWHCKDCGKDGQEIFGMEFIGHDLYRDDENDSQTDFVGKTESKEIKKEDYFDKMDKIREKAEQEMIKELQKEFPNGKVSNVVTSKYNGDRIQLTVGGKRVTIYFMEEQGEDGKPWFMAVKNRTTKESYTGNIKDVISYIKNEILTEAKNKKEENAKRRLKEENNKSANLISQMMQEKGFDAESNAGKIILRTSALFNALSEKGYDVQVAFDNGESTSAVLLGEQGGQVLVTITDAQQQLKSFASGNFEVNDDNIAILNNVADIVKTV